MKNSKSKIFAQFSAGIFGGTILGITEFLIMMNYPGTKDGCFPLTDSIFGTLYHKLCGYPGAIAGIIVGTILGIVVISKIKISNYSKTAIMLVAGSFLLPLFYGAAMIWPPLDGRILIILLIILGFIFASIVPSLIITGAINWRKFLKRK